MPGKSKQNLPLIKRVRACRIYTYDNQKYLDFFQESGKDILGSNPKGLANALKNEIEKGNYCNYPSGYEKKVLKALHELAGKSIFSSCFFAGFHDMLNYVSLKEGRKYILCSGSSSFSGIDERNGNYIYSWYPFCGTPLYEFLRMHRYVMPVLPFPGSFAPAILLSSENDISNDMHLSPFLLAGLKVVIYRLIQHIEKTPYKDWIKYKDAAPGRLWNITLPYLVPAYREEQHEFVFKTFLENRILLQFDYSQISALPAEISDGERMLFLKTADKVFRGLS